MFVFGGPLAAGYWVYRDVAARGSERARRRGGHAVAVRWVAVTQ
ncbi:hypothetical protein [Haloarcula onubensis]|nr:hypothetical protein [Halomicroarcula sp. S3CR25-11]